MQQHPYHSALSTASVIRQLGRAPDEEKMTAHDLVVMLEQVAASIGVCSLVHLIF